MYREIFFQILSTEHFSNDDINMNYLLSIKNGHAACSMKGLGNFAIFRQVLRKNFGEISYPPYFLPIGLALLQARPKPQILLCN
jgi:hypothetical protein